ncbi:MAG: PLD nuclease N-terminal domain-containing protein [Candidatus Aenigmatarchaeota archaeon]|nr:PLD nuclease N-terminal domain-containing protein [Candidatus Aenigmarchaeota archaeon]
MAKTRNFVIFQIILFIFPLVLGQISYSDKIEIQNQIITIENSINNNDLDSIFSIISPNARPELRSEIENNIAGQKIKFEQSISSYEDLENSQVKVNGVYSAKGGDWSINGMPNYFIFEKIGDSWLLVDTDFHQKLGSEYVFEFVGKILLIVFIILLVLGAFWLWMLIDAINRQFENKTVWIIVMVLTGFLGAILYFFIVRRKLKKQEKQKEYQNQQQNIQYQNW